MIITIDGPTASGKSTLAKNLAYSLSYYYLNSGLLFRALAYIILNEKRNSEDYLLLINYDQIKYLISNNFEYFYDKNSDLPPKIIYNSKDITAFLKSAEIDKTSSILATNQDLRRALFEYQRALCLNNNIIADGRDCGTIIFPDANIKIYLTAAPEIRAKRWQGYQLSRGKIFSLEESLEIINQRDKRDANFRADIKLPADIIIIDNSNLDQNQTQEYIFNLVKNKSGI